MGSAVNSPKMKLLAFFLFCVTFASAEEDQNGEYEPEKKFLLGVVRTNVVTTLSTSVISRPVLCSKAMGTSTCSGRRLRSRKITTAQVKDIDASLDIEPSQDDQNDIVPNEEPEKSEKLIIWATTTTTIVFTSTSTLTGTTLSISYGCTVSGMSVAPAC